MIFEATVSIQAASFTEAMQIANQRNGSANVLVVKKTGANRGRALEHVGCPSVGGRTVIGWSFDGRCELCRQWVD